MHWCHELGNRGGRHEILRDVVIFPDRPPILLSQSNLRYLSTDDSKEAFSICIEDPRSGITCRGDVADDRAELRGHVTREEIRRHHLGSCNSLRRYYDDPLARE